MADGQKIEGGEITPAHWQNWPGLLKWSMQYQDGTANSSLEAMSKEKKEWLQKVMKELSHSEVDVIGDAMKVLVKYSDLYFEPTVPDKVLAELSSVQMNETKKALERILSVVDNVDNANDLIPLGTLEMLIGLLRSKYSEVQSLAAQVIGEAAQNNPTVQAYLMDKGGLTSLIHLLQSDSAECATSALTAISSFIRSNLAGTLIFTEINGWFKVAECIEAHKQNDRLVKKGVFLIDCVAGQNPAIVQSFHNIRIVELLVELATEPERDIFIKEMCFTTLAAISGAPAGASLIRRQPDLTKILTAARVEYNEMSTEDQDSHRELSEALPIILRAYLSKE